MRERAASCSAIDRARLAARALWKIVQDVVVMRSVGFNLLVVVAFVTALWLGLESLGYEMALLSSIALSVALTLLLNLVLPPPTG